MQSSGGTDKIGDIVARIVDLENTIQSDIDLYIRGQSEIYALINRLEDSKFKLILQKRYLLFEKWDDIAAEMGYIDVRNVFYLHKRASKNAAKNQTDK